MHSKQVCKRGGVPESREVSSGPQTDSKVLESVRSPLYGFCLLVNYIRLSLPLPPTIIGPHARERERIRIVLESSSTGGS